MTDHKTCPHIDQVTADIEAKTPDGCEECLQSGDSWVSLRKCLTCGHIGCCDSSKNKHATRHFKTTQHPIIEAFGEANPWRWCYVDETYVNA